MNQTDSGNEYSTRETDEFRHGLYFSLVLRESLSNGDDDYVMVTVTFLSTSLASFPIPHRLRERRLKINQNFKGTTHPVFSRL